MPTAEDRAARAEYRRRRARHTSRGGRVLWRVPMVLIEYPIEIGAAIWGIAAGAPALVGLTHPPALAASLPPYMQHVWAACALLGGLSVAYGLIRKLYVPPVARGLWLVAAMAATHAVAILTYYPLDMGWTFGLAVLVTAAGWGWRGWWLRARQRILLQVRDESR